MRFLIIFATGTLLGCATADQVHALEQRVDALEMELNEHPSIIIQADGTTTAATTVEPTGTGGNESEASQLVEDIRSKIASGEAIEAKALFERLRTNHGGTEAFARAERLGRELAVVNNRVTTEEVTDGFEEWYTAEEEVSLDSGITLLVFFEQWCPHCATHVPHLVETYNTYRDQGLRIVGLTKASRGTTREQMLGFIQEHDLNFPVVREDSSVSNLFSVSGVPAAAIVKDGRIVWRGNPAQLRDSAWANLI